MDNQSPDPNEVSRIDTEPATVGYTPPSQNTPPTPSTPPVQPQKNSNRRRNIFIAIIVVILIAALALAWLFTRPNDKSTKVTTAPVAVKPMDNAQTTIAKVTTALSDKSSASYQSPTIAQLTPSSKPPATSPSYKASGADYYVTTTQTYGLNATNPANAPGSAADQTFSQAIIDRASSILASNQYTKSDSLVYGTEYQSSTVVCLVSMPGSTPVAITCANKADYAAVSSAVKPFIPSYQASPSAAKLSDAVFSSPVIKDSSVAGYQNATINLSSHTGISGAALLFYRYNNDNWQFFLVTQNTLSCSDLKTADERSAFADEQCGDANGKQTTVAASQSSQTNTTTPPHMTTGPVSPMSR